MIQEKRQILTITSVLKKVHTMQSFMVLVQSLDGSFADYFLPLLLFINK
jgi:hypothetical protein